MRPEPETDHTNDETVDDPAHQPPNRHLHPALLPARDRDRATGRDICGGDRRQLLEGLSFPAYRRVATTIFLPSRPGDVVSGQLVTLAPLELDAAEKRDASNG